MSESPITQWIAQAKQRDSEAEQAIWNHYFQRVVRLARSRMFSIQSSVYDEEDAAISAINSVFRGMQASRFPDLSDRHNLWRLLVVITKRKLRAQWRRENAERRKAPAADPAAKDPPIEEVISQEPTPDFVAQMMDQFEHLVGQLGDNTLQRIALMKLEGFTYDEIADRLNCTSRTVFRKMERIRDLWGPQDAQ